MLHDFMFYQDAKQRRAAIEQAEAQKIQDAARRKFEDIRLAVQTLLPQYAEEILSNAAEFDTGEGYRRPLCLAVDDLVIFGGYSGFREGDFSLEISMLHPVKADDFLHRHTIKTADGFAQALAELEAERDSVIEQHKRFEAQKSRIQRIEYRYRAGAARLNHVLQELLNEQYLTPADEMLLAVANYLQLTTDYDDHDYSMFEGEDKDDE